MKDSSIAAKERWARKMAGQAKFIREITFLDRDLFGYWKLRGYSNTADPWTEDRFALKDQIQPEVP